MRRIKKLEQEIGNLEQEVGNLKLSLKKLSNEVERNGRLVISYLPACSPSPYLPLFYDVPHKTISLKDVIEKIMVHFNLEITHECEVETFSLKKIAKKKTG